MVFTITMDARSLKNIKDVQQIIRKFPDGINEASKVFGKSVQNRVKRNITAKRLMATGALWNSVKWTQKKNVGTLSMLAYGAELQHNRPVSLVVRPRSRLWKWAFLRAPFSMHHGTNARFPGLQAKLRQKRPIILHKYDVYEGPILRAEADLVPLLSKHLDKVLKSNGRRA